MSIFRPRHIQQYTTIARSVCRIHTFISVGAEDDTAELGEEVILKSGSRSIRFLAKDQKYRNAYGFAARKTRLEELANAYLLPSAYTSHPGNFDTNMVMFGVCDAFSTLRTTCSVPWEENH